ncbi:class I ribonucleotide reductase maintenance protein YfaE [Pseudoalteromonas denitrificans]|uniref:Ferredoxin n=1 Tax=Pseudoalteromonas denitrificans DSM 6059 TaxID=1123010 RepID=A0A1I1PI68_9GAMM|nr:class I ribonucleotide reductase maintenance protein YfaE [Pseudoalteromonas denitrificans]SFD09515.1 ferredoxin [Pseudoalteromonas denitrificans DSM 6059]
MCKNKKSFNVCINDDQIILMTNDKTLLESLESNKIESHYHCREGYCGACRVKITSGEVEYINEPLAFIRDGEILTCCCVPNSNLEILLD